MANVSMSGFWTSRGLLLFTTGLYALAIHMAHRYYLYPIWDYYGFTYYAPGPAETGLILTLLVSCASVVPVAMERPSSIVVVLLYIVVYVPTVVLTPCLNSTALDQYGASLVLLAIGFAGASIASRAARGSVDKLPGVSRSEIRLGPGDAVLTNSFVIAWLVSGVVLIATYYPVMSLAIGIEETYEQRALGTSTGLLLGYVQTYYSTVLSPALLALGLIRRKYLLILAGVIGCVVTYMIAAQRTVILLPVAMIALYLAVTRRSAAMRSTSMLLMFLAVLVGLITAYADDNLIVSLLAMFLVNRTLAQPGLTFSQYLDLFGSQGFTWWSHVRGLDLFVAPPPGFQIDEFWPNLGRIIGERVYDNPNLNANANLFSGDGVAAAGALGVIAIAIVFAAWLVALDRASKQWDQRFAVLVMAPVGLALTNAHFFTTMLSFGGLFWTLLFVLYRPRRPAPKIRAQD